MDGDARVGSTRTGEAGDTGAIGSRLVQWFIRTWRTTNGRRAMVWASIVLIAAIVVVTGIVVFTSIAGESASYKLGFSSGGSVFAADSAGISADQACRTAATRPAADGGVPVDGNPTDWVNGCVAAFQAAQNGN